MKIILVLIFLYAFRAPAQDKADGITGRWMSVENNIEVEVYRQENEFKARIRWFNDADDKTKPMLDRTDEKNHDKTMRSRKIIGLEVLHQLRYDKDDEEWQGGIIYDSSSGKEWDAKAWIDKEGLLKVRGYWHFSLFGQNMTFKRVKQ